MDEPSELYAFEYFDPLRRRWVLARCRAHLDAIRDSYSEFRLIGKPEMRRGDAGFLPPTIDKR